MWPPTVDCKAGPAPENGTWTTFSPAESLNSSPERCGVVPTPAEAKLYLPGVFLMTSTSSLTDVAVSAGLTTRTLGEAAAIETGLKSPIGSYGTLACRLGLTTKLELVIKIV